MLKKVLYLYRQNLLYGLVGALAYVALVVAGIRLTHLELFENYAYATPIVAMAVPAMSSGGSQVNLALGFGASRRSCYWGQQLAMLLILVPCLGMTALTFLLTGSQVGVAIPPQESLSCLLPLLLICLAMQQGTMISLTMEKGWRKSLLSVIVWLAGFMGILLMEMALLIDEEPLDRVLRPFSVVNPVWLAVAVFFLAAALVMGVIARIRFAKLVVRL